MEKNKLKKSPSKKATVVKSDNSPGLSAGKSSRIDIRVIIFFVVLAVAYIVFLKNFFSLPELTNKYIKFRAGWINTSQVLLYTLASLALAYFGYLFLMNKTLKRKGIFSIALIVTLIVILLIHALAFNSAFEDVDDNASYMIACQSLVVKGAPYYLYMPEVIPDTEGAIGLPLMLIPSYLLWGMDYMPMEIIIYLTMAIAVVCCYFLFSKMGGKFFGALMALLFAVHPYIVSFSSIIMTEIPFILWAMLAIYLTIRYQESKKMSWLLLVLMLIAIFMTYLTRAIGAGMFAAAALYLLLKSGIRNNIRDKKPFYKDIRFVKFLIVSVFLLIIFILYQVWARSLGGASQAENLAGMNISELFSKNLALVWQVMAQNIFAGKLARFMVNPDYLQPVTLLWGFLGILTIIGLGYSLYKKELVALFTIFVAFMLMIGNVATQPIVVSRYVIVFTPFLIYFLYTGIVFLIGLADKSKKYAKLAGALMFALLLTNSFSGDAFNIQRTHDGEKNNPAYQAFLDCAVWAKDSLPADAIVASRKERIFYIYSGLKGYKHITSNEMASLRDQGKTFEDFQKAKLEAIKKNNTSYLIIDTFNASTVQMIYPIVQNNPDKFKLVKTIGDQQTGACYVFEVIKWW